MFASKVHLSSWTRRQKVAGIEELGLRPTLTFSTPLARNEGAPSSDTLCDTSRDRKVGKEQWGVVNPASTFFVARPGLWGKNWETIHFPVKSIQFITAKLYLTWFQ